MNFKLKQHWSLFLSIVLNPWVIVSGISVIVILFYSNTQTDPFILSLLDLLLWFSSSVFGGIIAKIWLDYTEEKVIVTRGRAAIRNLKLLLNNIGTFEKRINKYIKKLSEEKNDKEVTTIFLEEVIEKYHILHEEVINSIENWTDIIPEANIKTQIGIITKLKKQVENLNSEIDNLNTQLEENKAETEEEKRKLKEKLEEKSKLLREKEMELIDVETNLNDSLIGGVDNEYFNSNNEDSLTSKYLSLDKDETSRVSIQDFDESISINTNDE